MVLSVRATVVSKTGKVCTFVEVIFSWGKMHETKKEAKKYTYIIMLVCCLVFHVYKAPTMYLCSTYRRKIKRHNLSLYPKFLAIQI